MLWFTGSMLEDSRGSRWFVELFYLSDGGRRPAGDAAGSPASADTTGTWRLPHVDPTEAVAGVNAPLFGVLVAFAMLFGDVEFLLLFIVRVKAKYMVILGAPAVPRHAAAREQQPGRAAGAVLRPDGLCCT